MKTWLIFPVVVLMTACEPKATVAKGPPPTPAPTPAPTPHPAVAAQQQAIALYPDLAIQGSLFHKAFLEVYEQDLKEYPEIFQRVDWPLYVAGRAGKILRVEPFYGVQSTPEATPRTLDRGAYDRRRVMRATPYQSTSQ